MIGRLPVSLSIRSQQVKTVKDFLDDCRQAILSKRVAIPPRTTNSGLLGLHGRTTQDIRKKSFSHRTGRESLAGKPSILRQFPAGFQWLRMAQMTRGDRAGWRAWSETAGISPIFWMRAIQAKSLRKRRKGPPVIRGSQRGTAFW